jgi:hypothetical protein
MRAVRWPIVVLVALHLAGCPRRGDRDQPAGRDAGGSTATATGDPSGGTDVAQLPTVVAAKQELARRHGDAERDRIDRGVDQVAALWRDTDGDAAAFCTAQFVPAGPELDALFARFEAHLEQLDGHFLELGRTLRWAVDVEVGPILPIDELLAAYDPAAHVVDDLFTTKAAFVALLNFPQTTLADRIRDGAGYDRRRWAEVRLTGRFALRVPAAVEQEASEVLSAAELYIAGYNLWMHHVLDEQGQRRFAKGKRLISHWNLRDELKANYADADAVAKQRTIVQVMQRIVTQTIPRAVIDNPRLDWNPFTNEVTAAPDDTVEADAPATAAATPDPAREPDTRFEHVVAYFRAARKADPYAPSMPTRIARAFERGAEMPEDRVRALIVAILESPLIAAAAREVEAALGRPLGPQDLWYEFGAGGGPPEAELDAITRERYPTAQAFAADLPRILTGLGFRRDRAAYLAQRINVDPSRGAGHAMGAGRRGDNAHLRTRVEPTGMNYKGYNIAIHELGHNVEQTFSLYDVDHTLLAGVPNTAFTEALAFLFQARNLELLGLPPPDAAADRLRVLDAFWNTWEIAGSALVEIDVWHWLYDHPDATAGELREATVRIAQEAWNRYYRPVLGGDDVALLGIYSHTISTPLYLFNYVLGHMIAFQVEAHVHGRSAAEFAAEFERISRYGAVTPDLWMQHATGAEVSAQPMLDAAARALAGG